MTCPFEDVYFEEHSRSKEVVRHIQFVNIIYIAITCPLFIGFNIRAEGVVLMMEVVSHLISLLVIISNFRTPVVDEQGKKSIDFDKVFDHYLKNGLIIDIFGMVPLNIILSLKYQLKSPTVTM